MPTSARRPRAEQAPGHAPVIARGIAALVAALLVASLAVRNAAVQAWSADQPRRAVAVWADHPDAQLSLAMIEIAEAMRDRKSVPEKVFGQVDGAARRAPLAPEPFLVHGVRASMSGDQAGAGRDYLAAQHRDPRSLPAAYFLADQYFRTGDARHGLEEIALLARLAPQGGPAVAPYLALYAKDRRNWPELRSLFNANPYLGDVALLALAKDAANAPIILGLASSRQRSPGAPWVGVLLERTVAAGDYAGARRIWAAVSGVRVEPDTLLFDPGFSESHAPPPFNWDLTSSTVGLAERRPGGVLHLMFYGQDDGPLARQLLVLAPGSYRLSTRLQVGASHPEALNWTVRCVRGTNELARVNLDQAAAHGVPFQVPAGCGAQWLELNGSAAELPQQSDVSISGLSLTRGDAGA
jgi:hypothetical protein